jgi:hypothetical protein
VYSIEEILVLENLIIQISLRPKHKEIINKYYNFCGAFGHPTTTCGFMAKLMNTNNKSLSKLDGKLIKDLQEALHWAKQMQREMADIQGQSNP